MRRYLCVSGDAYVIIHGGTVAPTLPIVGIGASAGGVEALEQLLRSVPADNGLAFVVVTHLPPNRESMLA
ncbi:MAG: hypothetical protein JO229_12115, partial [Alphaproteobacteria bacterium]|nr:hypothetical protein [Alphaproteobacteria bacterium]